MLYAGHNAHTARRVFGETYIEQKRAQRVRRTVSEQRAGREEPPGRAEPVTPEQTEAKVASALCAMGFSKHQALQALGELIKRGK